MRTKYDYDEALRRYTMLDVAMNRSSKTVDPIKFADWCVEGAIQHISNVMWEVIDNGGRLDYDTAKGCRCGGCLEWQLLDENDNIKYTAEQFKDFLRYKV